ncbi:MAG: NUDIX hydrolase [Thermosynechococcus sp.]|uniref:NUDIX hydrolase n=1 Tax=Thermosynechococcus sp. TaxID=2814275 RepID=UPI002207368B|nr:NUDIX hydrolase [Thermosynechococcus sp.]BCX11355.1 MAG: NUDIX hydrolase [Thermosynechococcus sp.]
MSKIPPEVLERHCFCRSRKFTFEVNQYRLPHGSVSILGTVRHPGGALAVPVNPEGNLILVKQYRFATAEYLLEFPAGTVEDHENPFATIEREIEEETGYRAHHWQKLGEFYIAPGYSDEVIYAYLATQLEKLEVPPPQDSDEHIEIVEFSLSELAAAIHSGHVKDAKTVTSFYLALPYLQPA